MPDSAIVTLSASKIASNTAPLTSYSPLITGVICKWGGSKRVAMLGNIVKGHRRSHGGMPVTSEMVEPWRLTVHAYG